MSKFKSFCPKSSIKDMITYLNSKLTSSAVPLYSNDCPDQYALLNIVRKAL